MTKKTTLAIIALLGFKVSQAQIYIGANAGLNNTKLYNVSDAKADERLDYVMTLKPQFGLELGYKINNRFQIGVQPHYYTLSQKYKGVNAIGFSLTEANANLNYLQVPLYLQFNIKPEKKVSSYIRFGLQYGKLLNNKSYSKFTANIINASNDYVGTLESVGNNTNILSYNTYYPPNAPVYSDSFQAVSTHNGVNNSNLAINLSYGYQFQLNNKLALQIGVTGSFGLTNISSSKRNYLKEKNTGTIIDSTIISEVKYCSYNIAPKPNDGLRNTFTNGRSIGLYFSLLYSLGNAEALKPKTF